MASTYNYTQNRDEIITGALRLVGAIGQGETPNATQILEAADTLNLLVKSWEANLGLPVWSIRPFEFTPVPGQGAYNTTTDLLLNYRPLEITELVSRNQTNNDVPLNRISRSGWFYLNNKQSQGYPNQFFYDLQTDYGILHLWPVPVDATQKIVMYLRLPFADFDTATDVPDFPQEWIRALKYGLACDLCDEYGVPIKRSAYLNNKLQTIIDETENIFTEDASIYFGKARN